MYDMIFKRKSFHIFRNVGDDKLTEDDLLDIKSAYNNMKSLYPEIKTEIKIVSDIARFAPSACNSQPWRIKHEGNELEIFRYRRPGRVGIMPDNMVSTLNRIDMGIYICFLELCLKHENDEFSKTLFVDKGSDDEMTLNAKYIL